MAEVQVKDFQKRVRQIDRRHNKIARGYVRLVERDGLLIPKTKILKRRRFPLRVIVLSVIGFIVFKGILVSQVGLSSYETRLETLTAGSMVERAGAWLMQVDPLTRGVAEFILSLS